MKKKLMLGLMLLSMLPWLGCQSSAPPAPLPVARQDSTAEFIADPDFPRAAAAAPALMKRILHRLSTQDTALANAGVMMP